MLFEGTAKGERQRDSCSEGQVGSTGKGTKKQSNNCCLNHLHLKCSYNVSIFVAQFSRQNIKAHVKGNADSVRQLTQ